MYKRLLLVFILLLASTILSYTQDFTSIEKQIKDLIESDQLPSLALGVLKDGNIIYEKAFGYADIERQIKSTIHTPYQLASLSKPITATAIMQLHEQGAIDIDEPISNYIACHKVYASFQDPSIRQVLNHTAGLGTYFDIFYEDESLEPLSFESAWETYGTIFHAPGKINEYSNLGYGLLDYIISKKTGDTYGQYLKKHIFDLLQMDNSFLIEKGTKTKQRPAEKYGQDQSLLPFVWNNTPGAGNVASSIHDLLRFASFHLGNLETAILKSTTIKEMQADHAPNALFHYYKDTFYGLGWYVMEDDQGQLVLWHEGGMMGASTVLKLYPKENLAIVLLTNTYAPQVCRTLADKLVSNLIADYAPTPLNEIASYQEVSADKSFMGKWEGQMHIEDLQVPISISIEKEGVEISYLDHTIRSFLTSNQALPFTSKLFMGLVHKNYFIGTGIGELPASDRRANNSHLLSLKLFKAENKLTGTIVSLAAAKREYYAHPYYITLKKISPDKP